ncbi:hypothetical protein Leryth_016966 [Lithospermum erythrorhizon]|nr:hypothetical protein Leryth_016966 [Lithospermum erythrorhizon]
MELQCSYNLGVIVSQIRQKKVPSSNKIPYFQNPKRLSSELKPPFSMSRLNIHQRKSSPFSHDSNSRSKLSIKSEVKSSSNTKVVIACSAVTIALAVANRVFYKLALVPLNDYPFFLAMITTFGYVIIYFSILHMRRKAGIITDEMLKIPKFRFVIIGFLEALGVVSGMYAAAKLPGPAIPILSQTFLVWQLALSVILLGRRYTWNRLVGCLFVAVGVVCAVSSGTEKDHMLAGLGLFWPVVMIISNSFQAGASILKESVFIDATTRLKGKMLDIFVVNSFGSGFQALFVFLFLPILSNLKGIPFSQLPAYLKSGVECFLNLGGNIPGCDGAPLLPLLYVITNICFNISALNLVKTSSAVVSSLVVMASVPVSIYILTLPLPYLPEGVSLSPFFLLGSAILVAGLLMYNLPQPQKDGSNNI